MEQDLIKNINILIETSAKLLNEKSSYRNRKLLSESYISLAIFRDNFLLDAISKTSLEYLMNKIIDKICYEEYFMYYMSFYYLPHKVYDKNFEELSTIIYQSNVNISCFRCKIHASDMLNFSLDSSADSYFFSRGSQIFKAIRNYLKHPFDFDISSMVYLSLNYYQALIDYNNCLDSYYNDSLNRLQADANSLFGEFLENNDFFECIANNQQLLFFWNSVVPTSKAIQINNMVIPDKINNRYRWILFSFFTIAPEDAQRIFDENYDKFVFSQKNDMNDIFLIVRILLQSCKCVNLVDFSKHELIHAKIDCTNKVNLNLSYFFKNYNSISNQSCSAEEIQKLCNFNDSELRSKVASCMQNVDKNELDRQIHKPHGTLEISDLDIRFLENGQTKYLCLPFKTGREITKASMDESYMYQLIKPFSHFGSHCMVVLITAKKCSQGLETYIQRMSLREPSWRIEVIQGSQLCNLLKLNAQF